MFGWPTVAAILMASHPAPIPAKTAALEQSAGTLASAVAEFTRQTGIPVEPPTDAAAIPCPVSFAGVPAWDALQRIADRTGTRIALRDNGRKVTLARRTGPPQPAAADGPFRIAVRQVRTATDFETGKSFAELALDIHWEPRVMVFRLDAQPTLTEIADDIGSKIAAPTARAKTPPVGALYATAVRLEGVPRSATKLARVAGTFTVTAADRMLGFAIPLADKLPIAREQDGVALTVTRAERLDDRYEVAVELTYPEDHPEFESFESFVTENRAEIAAPGGKVWRAKDYEVSHAGRRVAAVYRFPPDVPAGAEFRYTTPAPLREYPVRFDLKDVPLP